MGYQFPGAYGGEVTLSFDPADRQQPGYVLVIPFYQGKLLLTKNKKRGWEVPGGTMEMGEMPILTAIREMYEETGAELEAIEQIGQYVITGETEQPMIKSVYIARVSAIHPLPPDFETEAVHICENIPESQNVKNDPTFSPIMQDDVYFYVIRHIQQIGHPFAKA